MRFMDLKWTHLLIASSIGITQNAQALVIYGLDRAKDFHSRTHGPYTIQVGSFKSAHNANQLRAQIASKIKYPVLVRSAHALHTVIVGPLQTADAVRSVGRMQTQMKQQNRSIVRATQVQHPVLKRPVQSLVKNKEQPSSTFKEIPAISPRSQSIYIGVDVGQVDPNTPKYMTVNNGSNYPPPENVDQYSVKLNNMNQMGLQIGSRWLRNEKWIPAYALALRYQHLFRKNIDGSITQYSLPDFNNYSYRWGISSNVVSVYSKLNLVSLGRFMPYVDAGVGVALNQGMNYSETAYPDITARVSPSYRTNSTRQLSYNVGLGLDVALTQQLLMYVGYDFQSYGRMQSENGMSTWSGERLSLGTFNTNTGLIGLTYVLGDSFS
ncbi:SPOR domain-containing protein [Legionella quateirensis]|uniref:Opacity protein and related surface antigens n=1 Tax=Legionella quateirensis TaxID=45072 RepID=A0A378KYD7_9GAMM|nr:SPOR domain-containing protein [Legionella quateirensis]KTD44622.1 Sporulation related domain protein [Legionella quateirensis]STY16860.1 Opacity protein and related surface antigens [Legionella quateirensis]